MKPSMPTANKPLKLRTRNGRTVTIYAGKNIVKGIAYDQFTVVNYDGQQDKQGRQKRTKLRFNDYAAAKAQADLAVAKLSRDENEVLKLTPTDRTIYQHAIDTLKPPNVAAEHRSQ
jgi:hypothetical protein